MNSKKVRYMVEGGSPFSLHGEGLSIRAITRKSEVPVTVEIEGMTRRVLVAFQEAIAKELARREEAWNQQREQLESDPAQIVNDQPELLRPTA
jgi:hypothetical protein